MPEPTAGRSAGTEQGQGRELVHACPEGASGFTACCNRTPFELDPMSRMTVDPALVTCSPSVPPARDSDVVRCRCGRAIPCRHCPNERDSGHQGDAASFRVTVRAGDPASADRLAHAAAAMVVAEFGADVQHERYSGRDEAREAVARWLCAYLAPNFPGGLDSMDGDNRARFRLRATQILDLPAVAALSQPGEPT